MPSLLYICLVVGGRSPPFNLLQCEHLMSVLIFRLLEYVWRVYINILMSVLSFQVVTVDYCFC